VDPYYLIEYARGYGFEHEFLSLARSINNSMPEFTVDQLIGGLNEAGMSLNGSKIAVLGLSYKANVADDRESPSYKVIDILKDKGAIVEVFDPYFPEKSTVKTLKKALDSKDAVIIAVNHREFVEYDYAKLTIKVLVDGKNCLKTKRAKSFGFIYRGIGVL
jgi:UDP-N-acetyl-D-glucosamine dehydrogenase